MVLPTADNRESFIFGWHRTHAIDGLMLLPACLLIDPGRWLAMHTSKIARWPPTIEQQCLIDPGDAFVRDKHQSTCSAPRGTCTHQINLARA